MKQYCNKDTTNLLNAQWELKTNKMQENKMNKTKLNNFFEQKQKFIDLRRKRISELYKREEEHYRFELVNNEETPEQVRQKMEQKLIELKSQKEKERLEFVKINMERRFLQSADELRKNDADAFALECYLEQENQMLDKLKIKDHAKREEAIFDKLRQFEIKKQCIKK